MLKVKILEHQTNDDLNDKIKKKYCGSVINYPIESLNENKPLDEV